MRKLGIKYQLRITTLIPTVLVALLFALFYNAQFNQDLKQGLSRSGEAYIRQLLPAAQYALLRQDTRTLQGLINASSINPEVKTLAFYTTSGQLIAYRGGKHSLNQPFHPPDFTGDFIESHKRGDSTMNFIAPITIPKFNLYSKSSFVQTTNPKSFQADDVLGWLSIDLDMQPLLIKKYQTLLITIFISLLGLLLALVIHYFLSKHLYQPIMRLKKSMKHILSNDFETPIKVSSSGELGIIEQGCLHLQTQYLNALRDLNQHIETATKDLQESLVLLEEKNIELSLDKRKCDEKSRQKSEFIANMSHEIRTPMNGVIGFTNVLLESKLDPLQLDYVKTIKLSAQDLLGIINDILDFSKMDAGKLHLDCIPVDIRNCLDEALAVVSPEAYKKGIDLIAITEADVPKTVLGDPLRIKQIISNLISNAVKFTTQGHVLVQCAIEQETGKDYTLCIKVTDTGIGISPEDQSKLFKAFNQADPSITRRYGGSGLGLAICKKLCEAMQGRIHLKSEVDKGSILTAQIKLEKLMAYENEKKQSQSSLDFKALCFEGNDLHLQALCKHLKHWGIETTPVSDFAKLQQLLTKNKQYKFVFISVDKNSEAQSAELLAKHPGPLYVLIARYPLNQYKELGAYACLHKPISMQKLQDLIESTNLNHATQSENKELELLRKQVQALQPEILVAEDNPVNKRLLYSLLSEYARVTAVDDGEMALGACKQSKYHLILMDMQMPKLNGLKAIQAIRKNSPLNQHTPIILTSANSNDLNEAELKKAGIDHYLQKPIDAKQLLTLIIRIMNKGKQFAIDWELCVQKLSGDQKLAKEFLAQFIEELQKNRKEFFLLLNNKNIKGLGELAHKLHGGCCFCGVPFLQKKVVQLEQLATQVKEIDQLKNAFAELIQSIDAVLAEYEDQYAKN